MCDCLTILEVSELSGTMPPGLQAWQLSVEESISRPGGRQQKARPPNLPLALHLCFCHWPLPCPPSLPLSSQGHDVLIAVCVSTEEGWRESGLSGSFLKLQKK